MHIIIIGAGLGGLSATLAFSSTSFSQPGSKSPNHTVTLLERRSSLSSAGGGMNIRPGASRILHSWGLRPDLAKIGDETKGFLIRNLASGQIVTRTVGVEMSAEVDWGVSREALMALLWEKVKERMESGDGAVKVMFGRGVQLVEEDERRGKTRVKMENGDVIEGDLVLAADGIRSKIRGQILADCDVNVEPVMSDVTLYGVKLESEKVVGKEEMERLCLSDFATVWVGQDKFVVSRLNRKLGKFSGLFGIKSENDMQGLWDEKGDIEYVRECFADSCEDLRSALSLAESCDRWKLAELPDLPRWCSKSGRIALLGDSAHAMEPNAAQGYSMIVEDIGVLEYLLSRDSCPERNISAILRSWERLRKPRADCIKAYARHNGSSFLRPRSSNAARSSQKTPSASQKPAALPARSLKNVEPDMSASYDSAAFLKWALDYDAVDEARKSAESKSSRL